jgi:hypothetical protein
MVIEQSGDPGSVHTQAIQPPLFEDPPVVDAATEAVGEVDSTPLACLCLIQAIADEMDAEGWQDNPAGERVAESVARCHQILQGERACPIAVTCTELARAREMGYIPPWEPGHPGWDSKAVAAECKRRRKERRERRRRAYERRTARRREGDGGRLSETLVEAS